MKKVPIILKVNDDRHDLYVKEHITLLEVLREELGLTGTKEACSEGVCGSCTVLIDGNPVRACLTLALEARDVDITTVEGLGSKEEMEPIQEAFIAHGAVQCGFCAPGVIMTVKAFLSKNPNPTEEEVRKAISANICRCTGYAKMVEAIMSLSKGQK